jgi:hypothetical protein
MFITMIYTITTFNTFILSKGQSRRERERERERDELE